MPVHRHLRVADKLLHQAEQVEPGSVKHRALVAEAHARAALAHAEEAHLANLVAAYRAIGKDGAAGFEFDGAHRYLRRLIRRLLGIFPPLTFDGQVRNGGTGLDDRPRFPAHITPREDERGE